MERSPFSLLKIVSALQQVWYLFIFLWHLNKITAIWSVVASSQLLHKQVKISGFNVLIVPP